MLADRREAVCRCGKRCRLGHAEIRLADGRAQFGGVTTCGSVWVCPPCANKIAEERRKEVRALAERHCRAGGTVHLAAFTFSHTRLDGAKALRALITASWSKLIAGAPWQRAAGKAGCIGVVRAVEVTHGRNGWHPHIHAAFYLANDDEAKAAEFGVWLFDRWSRIIEKAGHFCNPDVWQFEVAAHYLAAVDYVAKGNFDFELTRGHMKLAKRGGRTPFQMLADAGLGDTQAGVLFREFAAAFKGARQLTYSKGLRQRYALADEASDDELAAKTAGVSLGVMPAHVYVAAMWAGLGSVMLDEAEKGGWAAVLALLKAHRLWGGDFEYTEYRRHPKAA